MTPHEAGLVLNAAVIACIAGGLMAAGWAAWEAWARSRAFLALIGCDWCSGVPGAVRSQCPCGVPCGMPWCRKLTEASRG